MSIEQKEMVTAGMKWFLNIVFAILGFLLVQSFYEVKSDIKEISKDIRQIEGRLMRVETLMKVETKPDNDI